MCPATWKVHPAVAQRQAVGATSAPAWCLFFQPGTPRIATCQCSFLTVRMSSRPHPGCSVSRLQTHSMRKRMHDAFLDGSNPVKGLFVDLGPWVQPPADGKVALTTMCTDWFAALDGWLICCLFAHCRHAPACCCAGDGSKFRLWTGRAPSVIPSAIEEAISGGSQTPRIGAACI